MDRPDLENNQSTPDAEKRSQEQLENATKRRHVDEKEEKRLMRKLDRRIVPMMVWMYLMVSPEKNLYRFGWRSQRPAAERSGCPASSLRPPLLPRAVLTSIIVSLLLSKDVL